MRRHGSFRANDGSNVPPNPRRTQRALAAGRHPPARRGPVQTWSEAGALLERDPDTVRGPDLAFYSRARIPEHGYATTFWGPPDLVVEVTSHGNRASDVQQKVTEYLKAGVRLVWVLDPPTRTATAYRPDGEARIVMPEDMLDGGDVVPGFLLPLASFFSQVQI